MTTTDDKKREAADREAARRTRIREANERIAALPDGDRGRIHDRANTLETEARRGGSREAHVTFLERALDERATDDRALDKATAVAAAGLAGDLVDKARRMRTADGLTVAEIAGKLGVGADAVQGMLGDVPRGKPAGSTKKKATTARKPPAARDARGSGVDRQERCPACSKWKGAEQDDQGRYVKEADYRENRADCRGCYNARWREGNEARKAARKTAGARR